MRDYKSTVARIIQVLEEGFKQSLLGFDDEDLASKLGDWQHSVMIDNQPVSCHKRGVVKSDDDPRKDLIRIVFTGTLTISTNKLIDNLLAVCEYNLLISQVGMFCDIDFTKIPLDRIRFRLTSGGIMFWSCNCQTKKPGMFISQSGTKKVLFRTCTVDNDFLESQPNYSTYSFAYTIGLHDCKQLWDARSLIFDGNKQEHFPLSLSGARSLNNLDLVISGNEIESLRCFDDVHKKIKHIPTIALHLSDGCQATIPLMSLYMLKTSEVQLWRCEDTMLSKCTRLYNNHIPRPDHAIEDMFELQDQMIEIGGGKYARIQ